MTHDDDPASASAQPSAHPSEYPSADSSARSARERLLEEWFDDLPLLVGRLEQVHLPDGVELDYGAQSLAALERALLDEPGGPDGDFVHAAAGYVGEVLLAAGGGRWDVDIDAQAGAAGDPVVRPDPALGLAPLSPAVLIEVALAEDGGEVLAREHERILDAVAAVRARDRDPDWRPRKEVSPLDPLGPQPRDPRLTAWLREREAAFPAWAAEAAGGGGSAAAGLAGADPARWDFSLASLDLLEQQVRARYATPADLGAVPVGPGAAHGNGGDRADGGDAFLAGAVWYLGQVVCRHRDAQWLYWPVDPSAPPGDHHHPDNPWSGVPFTTQPGRRRPLPLDPLSELTGLLRFGPAYHLRPVVENMG